MRAWLKKYPEFFFCLSLFLVFNGIDYAHVGDIIRNGKFRYLMLALVPLVFCSLKKRLTWAPAFVGALALFSFVTNHYMPYAAFPLILILGCLWFSAFAVTFKADLFGKVLLYSGLLQGLLAIWQKLGLKWFAVGLLGNETLLGPFCVCALAYGLWHKRWLLSAPILLAILLTGSSMSYASLAAVLFAYVWHLLGKEVASALAFAAVSVLLFIYNFSPNHEVFSLHGRAFIWKFGTRAWHDNYWLGGGIGSWAGVYLPKYAQDILVEFRYHLPFELHSDYLDFLVAFGALPFLVLAFALLQFVVSFKATWTHAICAALLVDSLASFPFFITPLAVIFVIAWAHSMKPAFEKTYAVS